MCLYAVTKRIENPTNDIVRGRGGACVFVYVTRLMP